MDVLAGNWILSFGPTGVTQLDVTGMSFPLWIESAPGLFLEVSICVVASALKLKHGSATMLEISIFSCWKFC